MAKDYLEGEVLLINKELGWTSFDVVNKARNLIKNHLRIKKIKIGHAGTLDPLATGLLILCTGRFTKRIDEFQDLDKEYTGTFYIGKTTPCYDLEKEPDQDYPVDHITDEILVAAAKTFLGEQAQIPPMFSAIKLDGKPLYIYARKDQEVVLKSRQVRIDIFELTRIALPLVDFRVVCGKGTYIRSLARDFGEAVGSGAYIHSLCRTRIGDYCVENAVSLEQLAADIKNE
jgi:tRNA pseudouridine55 synthase